MTRVAGLVRLHDNIDIGGVSVGTGKQNKYIHTHRKRASRSQVERRRKRRKKKLREKTLNRKIEGCTQRVNGSGSLGIASVCLDDYCSRLESSLGFHVLRAAS